MVLLKALTALSTASTGGKSIRATQEGIFQMLSKHGLNKRNNKRTWGKKEMEFKETSLFGAEIVWTLFVEKRLGTIPAILSIFRKL